MITIFLRNAAAVGLLDAIWWHRRSRPASVITDMALRIRVQQVDNLLGDCICKSRGRAYRSFLKARDRFARMLQRLESAKARKRHGMIKRRHFP